MPSSRMIKRPAEADSPRSPRWVRAAARLPLAFAQVREDPEIDRRVADRLPDRARVCLVASGGCTAALLAAHPQIAALQVVDPNPAQLALARLKLSLLEEESRHRLSLLGHSAMDEDARAEGLSSRLRALELPEDALGPPAVVARLGPDHAGRYERCFAAIREALEPVRPEVRSLLSLGDPDRQRALADPDGTLGKRIDDAFAEILALPNLVALFGAGATANPAEPFARHFARRLRWALGAFPARENCWIWQMLLCENPPTVVQPWLSLPRRRPASEITCFHGFMADALTSVASGRGWDFVHLSNILDWLDPDEAASTLDLAWEALNPGGFVLVRQLNSTLDIRAAGGRFRWMAEGDAWHAEDRSFFYRRLHLGQKP